MKLTKEERKKIRDSIMNNLSNDEDMCPAAKIELKMKVLMEDTGANNRDSEPVDEVEDINEEDIGDFPKMKVVS
ncbi:hypothetical protein DRO66_11630 [Candidatus Bathyarchaeota archaeon]|nr:MAG: hypothetical protein DRO66_11630 [Candidatus Bathyarchaeota archaeon]